MRRKTIIFALLFVATGFIIAYVTISVKSSTSELIQDRLEYRLTETKMQSTNAFKEYRNMGEIINAFILHDAFLKNQFSQLLNSTSSNQDSLVNQLEYNYLKNTLFQKSGFTTIDFNLHKSNSRLNEKSFQGFKHVESGLFYVLGFYNQIDSNLFLQIQLGIDAQTIKKRIQSSSELENKSIAFVLNDRNSINDEAKAAPNHNSPAFRWIMQASSDSTLLDKAFFYKKKDGILIEAILKIESANGNKSAFMIVRQNDNSLYERLKWNNRIIQLNWLIVFLVMSVLGYSILKQEDLSTQKSEIQEALGKLEELNNSKDIFFSIIAHDLKNPFNGIMGLSGYLNDEYKNVDDVERQEIIQDINVASKNAFHLLQNLLEWTRAQADLLKNVPAEIDPATIIDLSLETVTNLAKNKGINLEIIVKTDQKGFADENIVSTILRNLATNAVKFSPRNSIIKVIARQYKEMMVFAVKDEGVGLSSDEIDRLFRIDVNFHKRGTEHESGSGLGLKLCKTFVERTGGRIWVISERGKGSTFYFTIPLMKV